MTPQKLSLASVLSPPVEQFCWGRLLPLAKTTVFFGPTSVGKSALLASVVCSVAGGAPTLHGLPVKVHGPVLVVSAEDSDVDWCRKLGALHVGTDLDVESALENIHLVDLAEGQARLSEVVTVRDATTVRREARPTAMADGIIAAARDIGAVLVVVETVSRLVDAEDNESLSALQSALGRIARSTGAAVVISHHSTKAAAKTNDASIESARGGGSLIANSRSSISLYPSDPDVCRAHRDRWAAEDLFTLSHGKATSSTRREAPIVLARLGTPHGCVFARPSDVQATPEQEEESRAKATQARAKESENLIRLYALVESLTPSRPAISPSYLYDRCHQNLGMPKRAVQALVDRALSEGVLVEGASTARGVTVVLGRDPRVLRAVAS